MPLRGGGGHALLQAATSSGGGSSDRLAEDADARGNAAGGQVALRLPSKLLGLLRVQGPRGVVGPDGHVVVA